MGDEAAWSEIWAELAPAVLGYLRGSNAPDPEDVLGETFLQVARDVNRFEGDWVAFRSWVFTVAHHRLIDARRPLRVGGEQTFDGGLKRRDLHKAAVDEIRKECKAGCRGD